MKLGLIKLEEDSESEDDGLFIISVRLSGLDKNGHEQQWLE